MAAYKLVVMTNAVEGREEEYNAWYSGRHLDDVLNVPGFFRAERFVVERPLSGEAPPHKYLAIYDFETENMDETLGAFFGRTNTDLMPISDALATDATPVIYRVLGPAKTRA